MLQYPACQGEPAASYCRRPCTLVALQLDGHVAQSRPAGHL